MSAVSTASSVADPQRSLEEPGQRQMARTSLGGELIGMIIVARGTTPFRTCIRTCMIPPINARWGANASFGGALRTSRSNWANDKST
jgi:hypothetical protein